MNVVTQRIKRNEREREREIGMDLKEMQCGSSKSANLK